MDQSRLQRWVVPQWPVYSGALIFAGLAAAGWINDLGLTWLVAPLLFSMLFYGLPHGALDDTILVAFWRRPANRSLRWVFAWTVYLLVAGGYFAVWIFTPAFAFVAFIVLTWVHWGQGDVHILKHTYRASYLDSFWMTAGAFLIRGGLPMGVTLFFFPEIYQEVASWTIFVFGGSPASLDFFFDGSTILFIAIPFLLITFAYIFSAWSRSKAPGKLDAGVDTLEICVLLIFFALLHPLVSIGLYFCFWHGLRHMLRLDMLFTTKTEESRIFHFIPVKTSLKAIPNTLASLLILALVYYLAQGQEFTHESIIGVYLVIIAVLTLPHFMVVCYMDWIDRTHFPSRRFLGLPEKINPERKKSPPVF